MLIRMIRTAALICCGIPLAVLAAGPLTPLPPSDAEFEREQGWTEIQAQLPPAPREGDLIEFNKTLRTDIRFFVDSRSIAVGKDGVIRYTLVVKSADGATNVSFEGIRCDMRESKIYALGRPDGSWSKARISQWQRIEYRGINSPRHKLYSDFFCAAGLPVATAAEGVDALKRGFNPKAGPRAMTH